MHVRKCYSFKASQHQQLSWPPIHSAIGYIIFCLFLFMYQEERRSYVYTYNCIILWIRILIALLIYLLHCQSSPMALLHLFFLSSVLCKLISTINSNNLRQHQFFSWGIEELCCYQVFLLPLLYDFTTHPQPMSTTTLILLQLGFMDNLIYWNFWGTLV